MMRILHVIALLFSGFVVTAHIRPNNLSSAAELTSYNDNLIGKTITSPPNYEETTSCHAIEYLQINPGSISSSQVICENESFVISSVESASGCPSSCSYFWELRYDGGEWTRVANQNDESFTGIFLSNNMLGVTEYRRGVEAPAGEEMYTDATAITRVGVPQTPVNPKVHFSIDGMYSSLSNEDVNYFWQTSQDGESMSFSSETHQISSVDTYYLRSYNGCWGSAQEVTFSAEIPKNTSLEVLSHSAILVDWSEGDTNDMAYKISRATNVDGPFIQVAIVSATQTEYLDDGLKLNETYYYRIQTMVGNQESVGTAPISTTTLSAINPMNYVAQKPVFNGNISAIRWKEIDSEEKIYTFGYDGLNRLKSSYFAQREGTSYEANKGLYSVPNITYDYNGNISKLTRQGLSANENPDVIDLLSYDYGDGSAKSNQLLSVSDDKSDSGFEDGNNSGFDYRYDANGNMTQDLNKGITNIEYNHLNLPTRVTFDNQNYIEYLYDAAGIKLQQKVYEDNTLTKTTDYVGEFIYETLEGETEPKLQLIQHEEGRIIPKYDVSQPELIEGYDYQYHLKDHLGNVRVTFSTTPENYTIIEDFENGGNQGFQDLNIKTKTWRNTTSPLGTANKINELTSNTTGAMLFLSLNKGDTIKLSVNANYMNEPSSNTFLESSFSMLFSSFDNVFGSGVEGGVTSNNTSFSSGAIPTQMASKTSSNTNPRAYLNYIVFDKDMNYVTAGFDQVTTAALNTGAHSHETLSIPDYIADREGYILTYLSNENQESFIVNFDDFTVYHGKTNIVSTQDYYPFGLTFNSYERTASTSQKFGFNGKEKDEATGWNDFGARMYMPEIARWGVVDPLADKMRRHSPYNYAFNNPIRFIDPDGMAPIDPNDPKHKRVLNSPVGGAQVSSGYKAKRNVVTSKGKGSSPHRGVDYSVPSGTSVEAMASGTVVRADRSDTYGNVIVIDHGKAKGSDKRVYTLYAHNSKFNVEAGDEIEVGQEIAKSGNTGLSTGPHVHLGAYLTNDSPSQDSFYKNKENDYDPTKIGNLLLDGNEAPSDDASSGRDPMVEAYINMTNSKDGNDIMMWAERLQEMMEEDKK